MEQNKAIETRKKYIKAALEFMVANEVQWDRKLLESVFFMCDKTTMNYMQYEIWR